jgi:pSer/pThr/pTyr-binding forkhead associated (FHA) protein
MSEAASLVRLGLADQPIRLDPQRPLTIGRDPSCGLALPGERGLSRRHAELRRQADGSWLLCDLGSSNGTWIGEERLEGCRPLREGDLIRLGRQGPALVFRAAMASPGPAPDHPSPTRSQAATPAAAVARPSPPSPRRTPAAVPMDAEPAVPSGSLRPAGRGGPVASPSGTITVAGRPVPLDQIEEVSLRRQARHPHSFSWWVLVCLSGLLLLPFRVAFVVVEVAALVLWLGPGSRQDHLLSLTLRDGLALRHRFQDRATAEAHLQGIRRALGWSEAP